MLAMLIAVNAMKCMLILLCYLPRSFKFSGLVFAMSLNFSSRVCKVISFTIFSMWVGYKVIIPPQNRLVNSKLKLVKCNLNPVNGVCLPPSDKCRP